MSLLYAKYAAKDDRRTESVRQITLQVISKLTAKQPLQKVNIRLWDGTYWPDNRPRPATLVLNQPDALKMMLQSGSAEGMGKAYVDGIFDIEGDVEAAFELGDLLASQTEDWMRKLEISFHLHHLPDPTPTEKNGDQLRARLNGRQHSIKRDRSAIQFHYDLSNEFYSLWLDPQMVYSCAYFSHPDDTLATAQKNKLDYICRKLGLKAGDRLLDIGCGWGGLILHAAKYYGVYADGVTLSQNQLDFIQHRIADENLHDRLNVRLQDYRELEGKEIYDAIASVGMVEHVGRPKLEEYFQQAYRLLKPHGLFMNHGIGWGIKPLPTSYGTFINDYVFPDTEMIPIGEMLNVAETAGLEVRDVESLREHYAMTLRHWVKRLEAKKEEALQIVDKKVYRIWRLYMAGCAHNFQTGGLSIYQTLLLKADAGEPLRLPLTRSRWYEKAPFASD